ncbi:hypothetical protein [Rudanella lutea]|uniref:hypothetical protein n=1 Tax=Rudanella lutea TaxID=451374 RepID=UPI0003624A0F|nr:hypothetical protein [Rudanella lutea]
MNIELLLSSEETTAELLDTLVLHRPGQGRPPLSVQFLCRPKGASARRQDARMSLPPLSWFEAYQLQAFTGRLATATGTESYQVELPEAGLRLTGLATRSGNRLAEARLIRVEPLRNAARMFVPFAINGTPADIRAYARMLYNRLWEAFCRG